jgi:hypothetical protein
MDDFATWHAQNWPGLEPELIKLDGQRRSALTRISLLLGGAGLLALAAGWLLLVLGADPTWLIVPAIVFVIIAIAGYNILISKYRQSFKERIIGSIVRSIDPSLTYAAEGTISEEEFRASRLFTTDPDRFSGEDLVRGRSGATALRFSELHAEYRTTSTDSKGNTRTTWHTIFKGLFFVADFNKHFAGVTVVRPDAAQRLFGRIGQMMQSVGNTFSDLELVALEDPEFEEEFVVLATDQVEARYILSTSLMRRILDYGHKTGQRMSLSFIDSQIHIAVPMSRDLFEPPLLKSCADPELIRTYLQDLLMMIGIVADLNLNLRIWSKQ